MENGLPPSTYQIKVALRGISPLIWRRFLISSQETLAELHRVIQVAIGWMDLHLHHFQIHGREYGLYKPGGLWFDEEAGQVSLASLDLREGEKFLYTYDFRDGWEHDVRLEEILPAGSGQQAYPDLHGRQRQRSYRRLRRALRIPKAHREMQTSLSGRVSAALPPTG